MPTRRRGRLILFLAVIVGSLGWVAAKGLSGNLVYYYGTPTELVQRGGAGTGERVRLGGLVQAGSVRRQGSTVRFVITDGTTEVPVVNSSGVPQLFSDGKGVVLEGVYGNNGAFQADTVLVQHEDSYRPPEPGQTPNTADL